MESCLLDSRFYGFFNFSHGQLGKIRRQYWKESLKISKIAKYETISGAISSLVFNKHFETCPRMFPNFSKWKVEKTIEGSKLLTKFLDIFL